MPVRTLARLLLYVLLLSSQLWPGAALQAQTAASPASARQIHAMPCQDTMAGMNTPDAAATPVCKDRCCPHMTCDAGACAAFACLVFNAVVVPASAVTSAVIASAHAAAPLRLLESPLRPPIV